MADESDVAQAIVTAIGLILYPTGVVGTLPLSVMGSPVRVARGWPNSKNLDADLRAGIQTISVTPKNGMEKNVTRYPQDWATLTAATTTLTAVVSGQTLTFGGTVSVPQNIGVVASGVGYIYAVQANDTLATIAAHFAAAIPGAVAVGAVVTIATAKGLVARVGGVATLFKEVERLQKHFQICMWCSDPVTRDTLAALISPALSALKFVALPDGTDARLIYQSSNTIDTGQKEILYRRDLAFQAEWAVIQTMSASQVVLTSMVLEPTKDLLTPLDVIPIYS